MRFKFDFLTIFEVKIFHLMNVQYKIPVYSDRKKLSVLEILILKIFYQTVLVCGPIPPSAKCINVTSTRNLSHLVKQ